MTVGRRSISISGPEIEHWIWTCVADAVSPEFTRGQAPSSRMSFSLCIRHFPYGTVSGDFIPDSSQSLSHTQPFVPDRDAPPRLTYFCSKICQNSSQGTGAATRHSPDHHPGIILTCSILTHPSSLSPNVQVYYTRSMAHHIRPTPTLGISDKSAEQFIGMNRPDPFASSLFS